MGPEELVIHELQRSQWLSGEEIARNQRPLLERMLRHAATQTDFYPGRLAALFHGGDPNSCAIDWSRWIEVPVLRRADAIDHLEGMKAKSVPDDSGDIRQGESSGSTGRPLRHLRSSLAVVFGNCLLERIYELFDINLSGSLAHITLDKQRICAYPDGGRFKRWNFHSPDAALYVLDINASPVEKLDWLQRMRPDHVMTYPETLREVAEIVKGRGEELRFQTFISTGEVLKPDTRDTISETFSCRVIDIYGAREIGPIAFQCPDADSYHVCAEALIFELLDDDDQPAAPGRYGRIVVTSLYNFAMPFIRYDIGDYAVARMEPCVCGRGLPALDQIAGRTRNMFVMPDGSRKRLRGALVVEASKYLPYRQIQFVQTGVGAIEVRYVPDASGVAPDLEMMRALLQREFHNDVEVVLLPVDRIERGEGMKIEQFISLVATA
ncbi:MAG: phenylacetate--CoA ligase family protein [Bradyrhizobiaceae bacterium]|nr:phenylacetate--CoA ligase family protein [Bradyrhizobiaceae bacterium]